jgi:hypothetical protein
MLIVCTNVLKVAMEALQRLVRTLNYNILFYAAAAAALLYALTSPMVAEPILNFCFAGIVPWSGQVLDPEDMILGVTAVFGLSVVIGLLVVLQRRVSGRRLQNTNASPRTQAAGDANAKKPVPALPVLPSSFIAGRPVFARSQQQPAQGRNYLDAPLTFVNALLAVGMDLMQYTFYALNWSVAAVQLLVLRTMRILVGSLYEVVAIVMVCGSATLVYIDTALSVLRYHTVRFGIWLQPRLRRLDCWIEQQCRRALAGIHRTMMRFETVQILTDIVRVNRDNIRQLFK